MIPDYHSHAQFELFPSSKEDAAQAKSSKAVFQELKINIENILVITILVLILLILTFSFGVKRGKLLVLQQIPQGENNSLQVQKNDIIEPISQPDTLAGSVEEQIKTPSSEITPNGPKIEQAVTIPLEKLLPAEDLNVYTIQVASFQDEVNARKEADVLAGKGFETLVMSKGKHSIVCVGKFVHKEKATAFMPKLKPRYNDCLVRRL